MRIVLVNSTCCKIGGVESYLEQLIPALVARKDEVALLCESGAFARQECIQIPATVLLWQADPPNRAQTLTALQAWEPDVFFLHSPVDIELKNRLLSIAPAAFFAHNYYGTCISGAKRHAFPQARPCHKVFSPACLAHYFPRRCGGLNPITMVERYRAESAWATSLHDFAAILVASHHMATEYRRHGFGDRVHTVRLPVRNFPNVKTKRMPLNENEPCQFLFVGRMEDYKGGIILLEALPKVKSQLRRNIQLTFAGDGRERNRWEEHAKGMRRSNPGIEVLFAGWLSGDALKAVIATSHLLVLPSTWPEPFGLVGLEAGAYGLPTAAFDVGGISDWLKEGVNGHLASGDPPTSIGLSDAILQCVIDPDHHGKLCENARETLVHFTMHAHLRKLDLAFASALIPNLS